MKHSLLHSEPRGVIPVVNLISGFYGRVLGLGRAPVLVHFVVELLRFGVATEIPSRDDK